MRTCCSSSTGATRRTAARLPEFLAWAGKELKPILVDLLEETETERVFRPQAVYGYWPAAGAGNDVVLFDPAAPEREVARFALPRQDKKNGLCIADFLRDAAEPGRDVLGLQIVTVGQRASDVARAVVRRRPLQRLRAPARPRRRAGRGARRVRAPADPRRARLRPSGRARARRAAAPGLSRLALFLRLSRLPEPRRPAPAARAARMPRASGSSCPTRTSCGRSSRPRRSSSTTPRRAISTCEAGQAPESCSAAS